jgi:hypothetical protein
VRVQAAQYRDRLARRLGGERSTTLESRSELDDHNLMLLLAFGLPRNANCLDVGE